MPIPGDERQVTRHLLTVCRTFADDGAVVSEADLAAARLVLARFFTLEEDGCWHNRKADEEIIKTTSIIEKRVNAGRRGAVTTNSKRGKAQKPDSASAATQAAASAATPGAATPSLTTTTTTGSKPKTIVGQEPDGAVDKSKGKPGKAQAADIAKRTITYLNEKAGTSYRDGATNVKFIVDRVLIDDATEEELRAVVDLKVKHHQKGEFDIKYLRPETLFNKTKFAGYVGQINLHAPTAAVARGPRMARVAVWSKDMPRETYLSDTPAPLALSAEQVAKRVKTDFANWLTARRMEYIRIEIPGEPAAQFSLAEL
jgi:uncharacterized phage protein (TIGR02220 family)